MTTHTRAAAVILALAAVLAPTSANCIYIATGGGFVNDSQSAPRDDVNDPQDSEHFFGVNPTYGHRNESDYRDFSEDLNGNPVYMDFSWGAGFSSPLPDDSACIQDFRSCLRILDNVNQTDEVGDLPNPTTNRPKEDVYEASPDNSLGYNLAENVFPVNNPGPGDPSPLGWFTHYNHRNPSPVGSGTVDVHWALRVYQDRDAFILDASDGTSDFLDNALGGAEAFFRLGIEETPNIGADPYDDLFWLSAISFDGIDWVEIDVVNDFPWFSFEDGDDLLSVNLYALSRNPRCPTCTGQIVSPEDRSTTGWVNLRLAAAPLPPTPALFGVGLLVGLSIRQRNRRRQGLRAVVR